MKNTYMETCNRVIEILKSSTGKDSLLLEKIDAEQFRPEGRPLIGDLGDYAPFVYWAGKSYKNDDWIEWSLNQAKSSLRFQDREGFFKISNIQDLNSQSDAFLGLNLMYLLSKDADLLEAAKRFASNLKDLSSGGFIPVQVLPGGIKAPLSMPSYSGLYIEELCNLYSITKEKHWLELAETMGYSWVNSSFFSEMGLFSFQRLGNRIFEVPLNIVLGSRKLNLNTAMTMKGNTNMAFGLLRLYFLTNNDIFAAALEKWRVGVLSKLKIGDVFGSFWDGSSKQSSLASNHAMIDIFIQFEKLSKGSIEIAKRCADAWLAKMKNGLVPEGFSESVYLFDRGIYVNKNISRLDSQTDFAVILLKLYKECGDRKYLEAAKTLVKSVISQHSYKEAFCEFVNVESLEKSGFLIESKYIALLLKPLLLLEGLDDRENINQYFFIARDR